MGNELSKILQKSSHTRKKPHHRQTSLKYVAHTVPWVNKHVVLLPAFLMILQLVSTTRHDLQLNTKHYLDSFSSTSIYSPHAFSCTTILKYKYSAFYLQDDKYQTEHGGKTNHSWGLYLHLLLCLSGQLFLLSTHNTLNMPSSNHKPFSNVSIFNIILHQ